MQHSNFLDAEPAGGSQEFHGLGKAFGDLGIRPKLMVLHNLFFLVLACAVYLSVIPGFERRVAGAAARETSLIAQMFSDGKPLPRLPGMEFYEYQEGSATALGIPDGVRVWLDSHPGAIWPASGNPDYMYRKGPAAGAYRKLKTPRAFYESVVSSARWSLFGVLAIIYLGAVLLLEFFIMPLYVYRPLRLMLAADRATQRGDKRSELVDEKLIPGDEIGQIMRSRNATVSQLRKNEQELADALARLEEIAADLKRKNQLLETAKRNLADQDRLVSLGLLSASVAHELNTPLAVLRGSIEKLMETVDDEAAQQRLARMLKVSDRLRKISEGLLDFARVRRQEMEPVSIRAVIEQAWELVAIDERAAGAGFTNRSHREHIVIGNQDRLVQVFVNLLRNALVAVKSSGIIVVESRQEDGGGQPWVEVTVEDNGPGIPPDVLPQIFEAFVTSRLDARGTGLGLTVAEGIVHQHGGTIMAANRSGGGARLEVRLPAAVEQATRG